jgi:hypothetical protein
MATVGTQLGQSSTDHLLARYLATSLVSTSTTNSPSRLDPRPTMHATLTTPNRHDRAA